MWINFRADLSSRLTVFNNLHQEIFPALQGFSDSDAQGEVAIIGIYRKVQERISARKTWSVDIVVYVQFQFIYRI